MTVGLIEKAEIYLQFAKNAGREHDREQSIKKLTALTRGNECIIQT